MALTAIGLCNRALLKIGASPINSFDDGAVEAEIAGALYSPNRDALLSAHSWSFASTQMILPRLVNVPIADYAYAFQLPSDFLRSLSAGASGRGRGLEYRITGRMLHCNSETVTLSYLFRPNETDFPAFFDQALIARLAAEFCTPLTESTSRTTALYQIADNEFRRARLIDSQQDTRVGFEDFSLIEARR
ncbi:Phage portal protein [Azospirillaceae bacterium]